MHRLFHSLLTLLFVLFVGGGVYAGANGVSNVQQLASRLPSTVRPGAPAPAAKSTPSASSNGALNSDAPPPFAAVGGDIAVQKLPEGRMTILLMGIDQRPDQKADGGDPGRTDSLMLLSVDFAQHTAAMASIPRDSYVVIPGFGSDRVNAAYTYGEIQKRGTGPALAMKTVSQLFGVQVDHYALVDIQSMQNIINLLGGIWIDNPHELIDNQYPTPNYGIMRIDIKPGLQLMDGTTAVEYARTRHPDSDYGRQARQQQVLMAIRDRALQVNVIPRLPSLLPELGKLVETNLSPGDILQLANWGRDLKTSSIVRMPPNPQLAPAYTGAGGAAYINLTPQYRAQVHLLMTDPALFGEHASVQVLNSGAPNGSGGDVASYIERAGFDVANIANGEHVTATRIQAGTGAGRSAQALAALLHLPSSAIVPSGASNSDVRLELGPDIHLPNG